MTGTRVKVLRGRKRIPSGEAAGWYVGEGLRPGPPAEARLLGEGTVRRLSQGRTGETEDLFAAPTRTCLMGESGG